MSTLHVVNKSPFERNALQSCVAHLGDGDAVILIEDAVLAAKSGSSITPLVHDALKSRALYVLAADLAARAIKQEDVVAGMKVVDYHQFVELVTQHHCTQSWL